jgi:4-hydroxyacetophenone monooxygenase
MTDQASEKAIDAALEAAHLPALVAAIACITDDAGWLKPEWRPTYNPLERNEIGVSAQEQAAIKAAARKVIQSLLDGELKPKASPSPALVGKLMSFVTGADIPNGYDDFLADELAIGATSTKDPNWSAAEKAKAKAMKVLVIGAGMSGLLTGIRLGQAGVPYEIIEKNADVGGTWLENTYPGCRVDSSNHMYSYSFEPNHQWPNHFSPQPVLLDYFRGVADRYDLRKHIRFETTLVEAVFDEARSLWRVKLKDGNGERWVEANAVITAVGQLNRPRLPDIRGRDSFKGVSFHSAEWRHDVDLTGKTVAVIGAGASAFQFVPEIAGKVAHLEIFQRTPPWAFPTPHYHDQVPEGMKWLLETLPTYDKWYRFFLFWMVTDGFLAGVRADPDWKGPTTAVSEANMQFREMMTFAIAAQIGEAHKDLLGKVIPQYPLGGKRALLDNGVWLQALQRDNVDLITDPIAEITETGLVTQDGVAHDVDVIIYGTGFHASRFLYPMKFVGKGGVSLEDKWSGDPRAYLGMTTPGFPNLFMIYGPNTNIVVNGSIIFFSECSVRYIVGCLKLLLDKDAASIECRQDVHDAFNIRVDEGNKLMAWGSPVVTSWYKNEAGRVTQNWPFALVDYWNATVAPNPDDFVIERGKVEVA